jgi:PHS family inorganic phosphate transporter-like MFS transporter
MMAAVFSMQGAGQFAAALVALITTVCFKSSLTSTTDEFSSCHEACQLAGDRAWRIIVAFGAVPACFALYYRITIPETPRYTFDIAHDIEKADADIKAYVSNLPEGIVDPVSQQKTKQRLGEKLAEPQASWRDAASYFSKWKNFKVIFGTASSWYVYLFLANSYEIWDKACWCLITCLPTCEMWSIPLLCWPQIRRCHTKLSLFRFFLDLAFYGLGLNNSTVLSAIGFAGGATIYEVLLHNAIGNLILVCAGSIPGYWISVALVDTIGRKPIQIGGFFILTVLFCIIGFAYNSLSSGGLLALYILAQLFFNFGPNTTTFITPGECFPTRYRSTGHGISAASGKIGAIVAQVIAQPLLAKGARRDCTGDSCSPWLNHLMQILALFMLCGTLVSFLIPETKGRTLEELAGEKPQSPDGSLSPRKHGWRATLNPLRSSHPAGFAHSYSTPTLMARSPGLWGKRERIGIMTSPDLLPKPRGGEKDHTRALSGEGTATTYSVSVSSAGRLSSVGKPGPVDADDDLYINGVGSGKLPGWGAGWGVQRNPVREDGNGNGRVESIQLFDVGRLLK